VNVITLAGRAGRDPEVKYFESGTVVANLTLAVNSTKKDADADWFSLQIWGKTAQIAADYVRKGSQIAVTGRMTSEQWTDRNTGEKRSKPVVIVDRLTLLGSKQDRDGGESAPAPIPAGSASPAAVAAAPAPTAWASSNDADAALPF